jgi:NTP pyrophosphatase (non-canonical NTP hydrolase)
MNFKEYVPLAMRTCKSFPTADHINHMCLGIVGEMGELVDQIKKAYVYGKAIDQVNIIEEVGDVAYYTAGLVQCFPALADWLDSDELKQSINYEKLEVARENITRTILLNAMSAANLAVDLTMFADNDNLQDTDAEEVAKTLGTALFATAVLLEVDLSQACEVNIAKLAKRYGDKYSDYAAINRDIDAERAVLEAGTATGEATA